MNPYQNRGPISRPDAFIGRERDLEQIRDAVNQGVCVSLIGERRTGKSSCLHMIKLDHEIGHIDEEGTQARTPDDYMCVFVDCQYFADSTETQVLRFLLERFEDHPADTPFEPTRESLRVAAKRFVRPGGPRLIVIFDEIDVLARNSNIPSAFFSFLRGWCADFHIVLLTASKENSIESVIWNENAGSPFWNIFRPHYIGPFSPDDALWLVCEPSALNGHEFNSDEVRLILELGGYQPFFLQIACDHAFQTKSANVSGSALLAEVRSRFRVEARPHLEYLWGSLAPAERNALIQFVRERRDPIDRIRSDLLRKGVLVEDSDGPRVFSSAFAEIADLEAEPPPQTSLLSRAWARYLT
jgi:hypothetical protein